jgi:hypothetical protein
MLKMQLMLYRCQLAAQGEFKKTLLFALSFSKNAKVSGLQLWRNMDSPTPFSSDPVFMSSQSFLGPKVLRSMGFKRLANLHTKEGSL